SCSGSWRPRPTDGPAESPTVRPPCEWVRRGSLRRARERSPSVSREVGAPVPRAHPIGTWFCLGGLAVTVLLLGGLEGSEVGRRAAIGTGLSILASLLFDARRGFTNVIRADVLAILTLYLLTFLEMLFPQPAFDAAVDAAQAQRGATIVILGLASVVVGRHL